ncbi:hypothetical protein PFFCH_03662 [Plasmodium falciparum FCH/4]|uniref:Uncharacterized protein n=1 Tax=Plasmodium falciparum FCH/4 TaxID=1036724 RepID=A0A024VM42_PLAFA|nr:hypothetical protein PFFCH_03662 [Plasmodium falciparum FCH/4]
MSLFLLYIYNTEIEKDYKELKNYMKKPVRDTTNYTFLNVTDTCTGAYEEFNYGKNKVNNNNLESNSDIYFEEIYFEEIYFEEIYFEEIYFEEIYFKKIYFKEIYFSLFFHL